MSFSPPDSTRTTNCNVCHMIKLPLFIQGGAKKFLAWDEAIIIAMFSPMIPRFLSLVKQIQVTCI